MNLTNIGSISSNSNWKRIKGRYVAAAAGIALAVSAVAAFAPLSSASQPVPPAPRAQLNVAVSSAPAPRVIFYIVSSEAEQLRLLQSLNDSAQTRFANGESVPERFNVILAGRSAEALQQFGLPELMAAGVQYTIFDLTSPTAEVAVSGPSAKLMPHVASEADIAASVLSSELANFIAPATVPKASDADVLASVISTEQATYGVPSVQPVQRQASAADIAASVLSTELAAYGMPVEAIRKVSDADVQASARSGEQATYAAPAQRVASEADILASARSGEAAHFIP